MSSFYAQIVLLFPCHIVKHISFRGSIIRIYSLFILSHYFRDISLVYYFRCFLPLQSTPEYPRIPLNTPEYLAHMTSQYIILIVTLFTVTGRQRLVEPSSLCKFTVRVFCTNLPLNSYMEYPYRHLQIHFITFAILAYFKLSYRPENWHHG